MDKKRLEELYTRTLDGCLSKDEEREYAGYLKDHPEILSELESFKQLRADVRATMPASQEPPYPDFFNSHLARMVRESRESSSEAPARKSWFGSLGAWLLPAAAAAILAFFAGMQIGPSSSRGVVAVNGALPAVYSPIASVHALAVVDMELGGAIITLEGLDDLPDSVELLQTAGESDDAEVYVISSKVTF